MFHWQRWLRHKGRVPTVLTVGRCRRRLCVAQDPGTRLTVFLGLLQATMPRPLAPASRPAAPVNAATSFPSWKAEAVKALHSFTSAATVIRAGERSPAGC